MDKSTKKSAPEPASLQRQDGRLIKAPGDTQGAAALVLAPQAQGLWTRCLIALCSLFYWFVYAGIAVPARGV